MNEGFPDDEQRLFDALFRYMVETGQLGQVPGVQTLRQDATARPQTAKGYGVVPQPIVRITASDTLTVTDEVSVVVRRAELPIEITPGRVSRAIRTLDVLGTAANILVPAYQGGDWLLDHNALGFLLDVARQLLKTNE